MKTRKSFILLIIVSTCLLLVGCNFMRDKNVDHMKTVHDAISNQDYKLAKHHLQLELKENKRNKEAKLLLEYIQFEDYMFIAAFWEKDYEAMNYLKDIVYDIDVEDPRFKTPVLVLAAAWQHEDIVKMLLEAGADPNAGADKHGLTALMWSCKTFDEQLEMVRALLEAGADVDAISEYDETALSIALEYGNQKSAELLKEYGAKK